MSASRIRAEHCHRRRARARHEAPVRCARRGPCSFSEFRGEAKARSTIRCAVDVIATHQFHEMPADRQPEPSAAIARRRAVGLRERLEQARLLFGRHADARIVTQFEDARFITRCDAPDRQSHLAAMREFDGIRWQIGEHFPEPQAIADECGRGSASDPCRATVPPPCPGALSHQEEAVATVC